VWKLTGTVTRSNLWALPWNFKKMSGALAHTNDIVKRVSFRQKHPSTFRYVINEDSKKGLVDALVQPIFDYGDVDFNTGRRNKERLQRAHNNCVRFIAGVRRREHISGFRGRLGYMRLDLRRRIGGIMRSSPTN
jgi:hypothetical protein